MYELINELISHREKAKVVPKANVRGNKMSFRQSLRNLAAAENAKVPAERRVSQQAVFLVAERSLAKTASLETKTRQFVAYKEVSSFISLACTGEISTDSQVSYRDLLPVGHPLSSRSNAMTASALRHARSRWIAADPRVDEDVREVIAAAYFYDKDSVEYSHAIASLQVLVAGAVPREIYLSALTAAFSFGAGNTSAARSARARLQWRDRLGRWIEMGRGIGFRVNIGGNNVPINGKFIGTDGNRGLVQVKGDANIPDGIYPIESSNAQAYKALLPDSAVGKVKGKLSSILDKRASIPSKDDLVAARLDAPAGWKKNEDGSFGSDDDYIVDEADGKLTLFRKDKNGDKGAQVGEQVDDWAQIQDLANADQKDYDKFKRIVSAPENADVLPGSETDPYDKLNPSAKATLDELEAKKEKDEAFFVEKKKKHNEDVDKFEEMLEQGKDIEGRDIPEGWEVGISKYSTDNVLPIRSFTKLVPSADGEGQVDIIAEIDDEGKISFGHRAQWFNKNENGTGKYDTWEEAEAQIPRVVEWAGDSKSLQHNPSDPWFKETIPVPRADDEAIAELPEAPAAQPEATNTSEESVVSKLTPPEGAWKLKAPEAFEPEGRVDDEMSPDFSDDPEVIANKFGTDALVDGFIQGIVGKKDYALDLLEDDGDDEEVDDNGDPIEKKPGKPGPKKKKPVAKPVGLGVGALDFNNGEEWVPVEAIYLALKKQGYDADLLLAQLYDAGLGESKNQDLLKSLRKEENVQAETPLLDAIDPEDAEAIARANVDVALADSGSALVSQLMELNRNGEPNPKIVELADAIRKAKGNPVNDNDSAISEDLERLLDDYIAGALNPDATPEEKQAFQALWATITALDEGISDGIEETRLANGVFDAIKKYNGSAEWSEVKEFFDKNGNISDLIKSKQALIDGRESIDSDTSFAGAFFRLMTESSRYNQVSLHRGLQVPNDSPLIEKIKNGDVLAFDARSFSTSDINASIFAGALSKSTDKTSIVFTVKPNKGRSVDLTTISTFNEQEHRMLGNFKIVEVDETTTSTGRKVLKVEIEMLSKRDAVLEGLDTSYNELLIKDNASPEMPEGYHKIDPLPYESRTEQDFPDNFEDKPDVVARSYSRDALAETFRQAIEDGSGEVVLEWEDDKEVTVAVELIRDALQVQGVDTNALLDDIANADPEAQASDAEAEPVEQSVDNPVNALVEELSTEYDMEGWKKVGPQLGSNEGGFYEDAEGNRFYVKKPKSDLHAQNEVLASAFYKLLGVDAADIGIGSGDDGAKMTFSPDIIGSKQDLQEQLNNPEYLAKLQEGFAVDAWLGNWDVAGLAFDNVMSDGSGNPVRVDPGGALLFRAMGKPKGSLFGNDVNELDTLRDPSMNPQSAAVFGSMTDEQQKESARKLLNISNDDIDSMVDGIVTDTEAAQEIKDKLKARRQFILDRYDLLSEDTSVIVDNADISEEQDTDPEAVQTPEGKKAEIDSALDTAGGWAQEYADDENQLAVYRKAFQAVADQIDTALVDWRNGEISDEELPEVLEELRGMLDTYDWDEDDIGLMNNVDDIDEQLRVLKDYIEEENNKNAPAAPEPEAPVEAPEPVATESVTNPYKDKNGTPIEPGAKIRYEKKGEVLEGVLSRYDKNSGYVWVKMSDGGKPKVFSTKYLTVIDGDGGGGEGPKAPEAPVAPEPEAPEAPTPEAPVVEEPTAEKPSASTPFPTEPILNDAANELVKLFSYGMPEGGKILAVHEQDGMIAATPDGETVYIIDAKKKTNYTPEAKPDFFEPGGTGIDVFKWRQPTKEENDALLEKIAQNKSEPYGTDSAPLEELDVDASDEIEVPDGFAAIDDSTGSQIFAGVKVADKDGVIGTVLKVNKDNYAFVDFGNGVVKWRSGKTLKSTNTLDENFKGPTAKKSTTKATGAGAEPVIVDSPADWSLSSFEAVPSLPGAVAKALNTSDKKSAMRGASAAVDADSIEDLDVRVMHVRNPEGVDGIQLKFKLTNWAGKKKVAEIASMTEQERADAGIEVTKLRIPRITVGKDGVGDLSASEAAYESPIGRTYKITTEDGIVISIHRANPDASDTFSKGYGGAPARAFHNTVQIQAPAGATDDQIANALALAGVSQVRPATPADAKVLIENRLMSIFDAKTDANTNPKGAARTESLEKVKDKWGLTVDDVIVTTGPSGRIEYRLSEEGALKIWEATGKPEAMSHGLRNPGVLQYTMSDEEKVKAMTDWIVGFIDNPQGGLLSTTTRWTEGIGVHGQSSQADVGTGGADYVFTRPVKSADRKRYGTTDWVPTLYFDPKKVYQRLDFYANYTDAFGKRSKNKDVISAAQVGAYEVMFKQRLSWEDLDVMVVSKEVHVGVIEGLKARGINYIGGRPIEEVIITGTGASKS